MNSSSQGLVMIFGELRLQMMDVVSDHRGLGRRRQSYQRLSAVSQGARLGRLPGPQAQVAGLGPGLQSGW